MKRGKNSQRSNMQNTNIIVMDKSKTILLWFIIGILATIVILLFCFILTKHVIYAKTLASYASWTSTILSIVLSVLAIIYSYYSIRDTGVQMNHMNAALGEIKATNNAINENNRTLLSTIVSLHDKVSAIEAKQQPSPPNTNERLPNSVLSIPEVLSSNKGVE